MGTITTHHYHQFKARNRMEQRVVSWASTLGEKGDIEQVRAELDQLIQKWRTEGHITGSVTISTVFTSGTYVGGGVAIRTFKVTANGRKIPTVTVDESFF